MKYFISSLFLAMPLMAQLQPGPIFVPPAFPPALQSYLELTTEQVNAILRLNASAQQFQSEKLQRMAQVQIELAQETAKTNLDPMALGVRHLELEAIRREIQAQQQKTFTEIQNVLTAAQKTKVQALIEAMRLQSVICDAQAQNIIPPAVPGNIIPANRVVPGPTLGIASFLLGGTGLPGVGCTPGFRTGNFFTFLPSGEQPQSAKQ
jgi:hypothetical protein